MFGSRREVTSAVRRLVDIGMVELSDDPPIVESGCFCVSKPGSTARRLIIDCRPVNRLLRDPPGVDLPTPELFARMSARDGFWVAKSDLSDFYHMIALPPDWRPFFGLPAVMIDGVVRYPRLRSLPMGWSFSVFIAQLMHMHMISEAALSVPCRILSRRGSGGTVNVDSVPLVACYIDDVGVIGSDRDRVNAVQQSYMTVAARYGFVLKPSKTVRASRRVSLLGVTLDGEQCMLEAGQDRVLAAVQLAGRVCQTAAVCSEDLAAVVGKFNWLFLIRRPLLSVFNNVYRWLVRYSKRPGPHPLWECCRRELACAAGLAVCAFADLRLPLSNRIIAADASGAGYGVVSARSGSAAAEFAAAIMAPPSCGKIDRSALYSRLIAVVYR